MYCKEKSGVVAEMQNRDTVESVRFNDSCKNSHYPLLEKNLSFSQPWKN